MERLELLAAHLDFRRRGVTTVLSVGLGVGNHGGGNAFALCIDRADVFQGDPLACGEPLQNPRFGVVRLEVGERFLVRTDHLPPGLGTVKADKQLLTGGVDGVDCVALYGQKGDSLVWGMSLHHLFSDGGLFLFGIRKV